MLDSPIQLTVRPSASSGVTQVTAPELVDEKLCLADVFTQRGGFPPHRACPGVPAADMLALDPRQLAGHSFDVNAQRSDEAHCLSRLPALPGLFLSHGEGLPGKLDAGNIGGAPHPRH